MFSWVSVCFSIVAVAFVPLTATAGVDDTDIAIFDALRQGEIIDVMRQEGIESGRDIADAMFVPAVFSKWDQTLDEVYDTDRMTSLAAAKFSEALEDEDREGILAFFASEPGATLIALEVSARRAMLDDDVTEIALEQGRDMMAADTMRADLIGAFITTNDLIEMNVAGSLNSNLAFYTGLQDGGALPEDLTLDQLLVDLLSQEGAIRTETTEWMFGYLSMAYQPVSDDDLAAYLAFSQSPSGQALNRALFAAYEDLFNDISRVLGYEAAKIMLQAEL